MTFLRSYAHLFIIGGLLIFCTVACADLCHERYRLLENCTEHHLPFIVSTPDTTVSMDQDLSDIEEQVTDPKAGILSGLSLSPQGGGREFAAVGSGSVQTGFGVSFFSPTISFQNSEVYKAWGLFNVKISQGYQGG